MNSFFDFRTELYRLKLPIYVVAAEVGLHPSRLSIYLNGKLAMPDDLVERLTAVLKAHGVHD